MKLPGIGRYTAGAIASIAFNQPAPILDGNVTRVLCRVRKIEDPPQLGDVAKELWRLAEAWIPKEEARNFNQALMELGATVCLPSSPNCLLCPIRQHCLAFELGKVEAIPASKPGKVPRQRYRACAVIRCNKKLLFSKRLENSLLEGLWEFPSVESDTKKKLKGTLEEHLERNYGIKVTLGKEIHQLEHRYTNFKTRVRFYPAALEAPGMESKETTSWVEIPKIEDLALPRPYRRFMEWYLEQSSE